MPIFVSAALVPRNSNTFFIIEDVFLKGGVQVLSTTAERDAIDPLNRKEGMLVFVTANNTLYRLLADETSWVEFEAKPESHTHDFSELGLVGGKIPAEYMPSLAITETNMVNSQSSMLALAAQKGDVAVRTDLGKTFILAGDDPTIIGNWTELLTPQAGVVSVSGTGAISVGGTSASPVISITNATSSNAGAMSAADKAKLDAIAEGANAYAHPTGDGNLHVPATGTTNNGKVLTAGASAGSLSWQTPSAGVTSVGANSPLTSSGGATPTISLPQATSSQGGYLSSTDWVTFNSKGTGTVTSVSGSGAITVANGTTTPTISISAATTSSAGSMSAADKTKLDGIAANATAYTHPTGDGNLHVPATSTTNNGKVLTAGATAGSLSWTAIPYDLALGVYGQPNEANGLLALFIVPRTIYVASGASGVAVAGTAPTGDTTLSLTRNGTAIGSVSFTAGSAVGTVSITSATTLALSDVVRLVNPATPDTTIANIAVTIRGTV